MTPTYATYPQAASLEEYQQAVANQAAAAQAQAAGSAAGLAGIQNVAGVNVAGMQNVANVAVSAIKTTEASPQAIYSTTPVSTNGAEQQTVCDVDQVEKLHREPTNVFNFFAFDSFCLFFFVNPFVYSQYVFWFRIITSLF